MMRITVTVNRYLEHIGDSLIFVEVQDLQLEIVIGVVDVLVDGHAVIVLSSGLNGNPAIREIEG